MKFELFLTLPDRESPQTASDQPHPNPFLSAHHPIPVHLTSVPSSFLLPSVLFLVVPQLLLTIDDREAAKRSSLGRERTSDWFMGSY